MNSSILAVGLYNLGANGVTVLEGLSLHDSPHHIITFFPPVSHSSILAVGLYNLGANGVTVLEGISPHHIVTFFARHGSEAWRMLGGVMLCFTGVEAMFADLGHFSLPAIRVRCLGRRVIVVRELG